MDMMTRVVDHVRVVLSVDLHQLLDRHLREVPGEWRAVDMATAKSAGIRSIFSGHEKPEGDQRFSSV